MFCSLFYFLFLFLFEVHLILADLRIVFTCWVATVRLKRWEGENVWKKLRPWSLWKVTSLLVEWYTWTCQTGMCRGFCTGLREKATVKTCGFYLQELRACNEQKIALYRLKDFTYSTIYAVPWCHCDDGSCCTAYPSESKSSLLCSFSTSIFW